MAFLFPPPPSVNPPPPSSSSQLPPNPASYNLPFRRRRNAAFAIHNPFVHPNNRILHITEINILGPKMLPQSVIDEHIMPMKNSRVPTPELLLRIDCVNKWFADNFYVCSKLLVVRTPDMFSKTLTLFSAEPRLITLTPVAVDKEGKMEEGTQIKTKLRTLCNALGVQIGDVFRWKPDGFATLMSLAIFEYANAEVNVQSNEQVQLTLYLKERSSGRIEPGFGMSSDGRAYGDLSVTDNNFMGNAQRLQVAWQKRLDEGRSSGGIVFEDMRIGAKLPVSFKFKAYRDSSSGRSIRAVRVQRQPNGSARLNDDDVNSIESNSFYEKDRDGIVLDIGYNLMQRNTLFNLTPMLELIHPNVLDSQSVASTAQKVLQTSFTHATRAAAELPRSGHLARIEYSVGSLLSGAPNPFQKCVFRLNQYFGIRKHSSIALAALLGTGTNNLPWHEQKSLGGHTNVRGYSYSDLGRHKAYAIGRAELRVPLTHLSGSKRTEKSNRAAKEENAATDKKRGNAKGDTSGKNNAVLETKKINENVRSSPNPLEKLPPLTAILFGDLAMKNSTKREVLGASYGVGVRIAGVITVDWIKTVDEGNSKVHVGLADRSW